MHIYVYVWDLPYVDRTDDLYIPLKKSMAHSYGINKAANILCKKHNI